MSIFIRKVNPLEEMNIVVENGLVMKKEVHQLVHVPIPMVIIIFIPIMMHPLWRHRIQSVYIQAVIFG
jgi:hypothetical protein